tara:strand:+ start:366 stop:467 length:102 start_codon:yes stop_codon:yes gene_type:complete
MKDVGVIISMMVMCNANIAVVEYEEEDQGFPAF